MIYAENILLCIAVPLLVALPFVKGEVRRFAGTFLLGMAVCLISAYISSYLNLITGMGAEDTSVFLSPMVEELMKLTPLLLALVLLDPEERTLTMLAVAIGAGFATMENCCYILSFGAEDLVYVLIRGLAVGVMHVVSPLAFTLWLNAAKRLRALSFPAVVGGVSLAMIFHSLYNLLVSGPGVFAVIGYLLPLLTAGGLYLMYRRLPKA